MKKQKTLGFLVNNLEQWPTRLGGAPVIDGYTWTKGVGGIILFDNDAMQCESMEQMVIEKKEWKVAQLDNAVNSNEGTVQVTSFNFEWKSSAFLSEAIKACAGKIKEHIDDTDKPKQKIYVCGPMSKHADTDSNLPAFNDASHSLSVMGYIVLSPAILPDGLTQAEYMQIDLTMLQCCDAIYMLKGWDDSAGAMAEHALAMKLGLTVIHEGDLCQG